MNRTLIPIFEIPLVIIIALFFPEMIILFLPLMVLAIIIDPLLVGHILWFKVRKEYFPENLERKCNNEWNSSFRIHSFMDSKGINRCKLVD